LKFGLVGIANELFDFSMRGPPNEPGYFASKLIVFDVEMLR